MGAHLLSPPHSIFPMQLSRVCSTLVWEQVGHLSWMVKLLLEVHPRNVGRGHPTGDTHHLSPSPDKAGDTHP